jgi:hypothetical protein
MRPMTCGQITQVGITDLCVPVPGEHEFIVSESSALLDLSMQQVPSRINSNQYLTLASGNTQASLILP